MSSVVKETNTDSFRTSPCPPSSITLDTREKKLRRWVAGQDQRNEGTSLRPVRLLPCWKSRKTQRKVKLHPPTTPHPGQGNAFSLSYKGLYSGMPPTRQLLPRKAIALNLPQSKSTSMAKLWACWRLISHHSEFCLSPLFYGS